MSDQAERPAETPSLDGMSEREVRRWCLEKALELKNVDVVGTAKDFADFIMPPAPAKKRKKGKGRVWTPEQRQAQAERLRKRRAGGQS